MHISAIKQQVKNTERASIFVDGKYAFSLSLNELVTERLKISQTLDEAELKRLKKLSDDGKLKSRALEWILNRPRSVRELRDYLYRKKVETDQANALIDDFQSRGYLSDTTLANWLIDMRRRGGKSERAIRNELLKKGLSREDIEATLQRDDQAELIRLRDLYDKKSSHSRFKNDNQKLIQFLMRKGFNYEDIKQVITERQE